MRPIARSPASLRLAQPLRESAARRLAAPEKARKPLPVTRSHSDRSSTCCVWGVRHGHVGAAQPSVSRRPQRRAFKP
jgi:hypothetical protein